METSVKVTARKWGNSIAVVIPWEIVNNERITENEEIIIKFERKRPKVKDLWGKFPLKFKKSTQEIKDEIRRGWESASDRERGEKWKNKK